jgi:hypothetical protein
VVNLGEGRAASVTAPTKAKAGVFQHVAGTYDGSVLRLFVDGSEVTTFQVAGVIAPGPGPLLMGNDGSERRFDGKIDNASFEGRALSPAEVMGLTCVRQTPTVVVTPRVSAPTSPGVAAAFDIALTNNNSSTCLPDAFLLQQFNFIPSVIIDPPAFMPVSSPPAASGETAHLTLTATPLEAAEPGSFFLSFQVSSQDREARFFFFDTVELVVAEPTGCHVSTPRELMIKHLSVVDDPVRTTTFFGAPDDPRTGAWTFKRLMEDMAPTAAEAPAMVEEMLRTFDTPQTVNGFSMGPRGGMRRLILDNWPRTPDGALDLSQPPLQLQAIVNRFDLRDLGQGNAGEGRFVFAFLVPGGMFPLQATLILEYKLPAISEADVLAWANAWHALGAMTFSEEYNAALQAITERFAGRGVRPGFPNGSAINAVRTNEIDLGDNGIWELREFVLSPETGRLVPATIKLTPDQSFNNTAALGAFINDNEASIIAERHDVPEQLNGGPFLAGAVFNDLGSWFAPDILNNEARHHFAINTCNGCHSSQEAGVRFLQIFPRFPGSEAGLSQFLTGGTVFDPVTGQPRTFNDLGRRGADLKAIVCTEEEPPSPMPLPPSRTAGAGAGAVQPQPQPQPITTLRRGISRTH